MPKSLTGASAQLLLGVQGLFPVPQALQGFAADDIFSSEQVKRIETRMGVDGILSAGLVYRERVMNITLQANSVSVPIFDQWVQAEEALGDVLIGSMTVRIVGLGYKWDCFTGYLTDYPPIPDVKALVEPRKYTIRWQRITPSPV